MYLDLLFGFRCAGGAKIGNQVDGIIFFYGADVRTSTASDDASPSLLLAQVCHEVVRPPDLEAEYLLEVFALQPDLVAQFCA